MQKLLQSQQRDSAAGTPSQAGRLTLGRRYRPAPSSPQSLGGAGKAVSKQVCPAAPGWGGKAGAGSPSCFSEPRLPDPNGQGSPTCAPRPSLRGSGPGAGKCASGAPSLVEAPPAPRGPGAAPAPVRTHRRRPALRSRRGPGRAAAAAATAGGAAGGPRPGAPGPCRRRVPPGARVSSWARGAEIRRRAPRGGGRPAASGAALRSGERPRGPGEAAARPAPSADAPSVTRSFSPSCTCRARGALGTHRGSDRGRPPGRVGSHSASRRRQRAAQLSRGPRRCQRERPSRPDIPAGPGLREAPREGRGGWREEGAGILWEGGGRGEWLELKGKSLWCKSTTKGEKPLARATRCQDLKLWATELWWARGRQGVLLLREVS